MESGAMSQARTCKLCMHTTILTSHRLDLSVLRYKVRIPQQHVQLHDSRLAALLGTLHNTKGSLLAIKRGWQQLTCT